MPIYAGQGEKVENFARDWIIQTKGRWAGEALELEPWERDLVDELMLVDEHGNNVYREALVGVARKNGKSSLASVLALYALLVSGEAGAEVYCVAASKDQARIVFDQARQFVEASPRLADWLTPTKSVIVCRATGGIFRVLSSDAPLQHGLNPSFVVIDELHAHPDPELYYALTTGQLARLNPMVVSITTAGFDRESICWQVYEYGKRLFERGLAAMRKQKFLFRWHEAPPNLALDDPVGWALANPSSWITEEDLEREMHRLPEHVFRRLHLNQWTSTEDAWIGEDVWDACAGVPYIDPHEPSWGFVDVGIIRDSSAIIVVQWHGDDLHVEHHIMLPEENPEMGIADVREAVGAVTAALPGLEEMNFDPWSFRESAEELEERGIPMLQFDQTNSRMGPASEKLYELAKDRRIVHDGDYQLKTQVLAAVVAPTERGWRISKRKSRNRIDACISLAGATYRAIEARNEKPISRRAAFL